MPRDLRDVVNKIIVAVSEDDATTTEIAALSSDLATFFDASVVLVYLAKTPLVVPPTEGAAGQTTFAIAANVVEEVGRKTLERMAETMASNGVPVTTRLIMGLATTVVFDTSWYQTVQLNIGR